ncbi:hypothetical protein INR49_008448 [Caranx melampygus]|nr:hypothetical protein INR49_008448 [Caranx melampygus]
MPGITTLSPTSNTYNHSRVDFSADQYPLTPHSTDHCADFHTDNFERGNKGRSRRDMSRDPPLTFLSVCCLLRRSVCASIG